MTKHWTDAGRPGYFGRHRDEKISALNVEHGIGNWRLIWRVGETDATFFSACRYFYEESYFAYLRARPAEVDEICSYGRVIDNASTNVASGLDYASQEAFSTHIQDIAVRNVLRRLDRWFEGPPSAILTIRGDASNGWKWNPGNVPFYWPRFIDLRSLRPSWAQVGSVEDFWQSNKLLQVSKESR